MTLREKVDFLKTIRLGGYMDALVEQVDNALNNGRGEMIGHNSVIMINRAFDRKFDHKDETVVQS